MKIPEDHIESGCGRRCWVYANFYGKDLFDVVKKVCDYKDLYPPQGYDTHTYQEPYDTGNGYYHAVVKRYSTCD
jgi:hypothetical protein